MEQQTPPLTPDAETQKADVADGGWTVESHSEPVTLAPLDTTLDPQGIDNQPQPPVADDGEGDEGDVEGQGITPLPVAAGVRDSKTGQFTKPKPKKERYEAMDRARHEAERRADEAHERAGALERRLQALEQSKTAPPEPAKPAPAPAAMPGHPKYADFETDDEYQKAVEGWQTSVLAWQTARDERLKAEITSGLDQRLETDRQTSAQQTHQATVQARLKAMSEAHPDFQEKFQASQDVLSDIKSVFLNDLIENTPEGAEFLYDLASDHEMAQALAALPLPTRPLADAVRRSPAARTLMKHFATDDGREDFLRMRTLHPVDVLMAVGELKARLDTADRGPVTRASHPITHAAPPAKPPVGTPRARDAQPRSGEPTESFEEWNANEDRKDREAKLRAAGLPVSA